MVIFRKNLLIRLLWFLFFFLMIFMPRQLQAVKIGLMLLILLVKLFTNGLNIFLRTRNRYVNRFVFCWFASAILRIGMGVVYGNPGIPEAVRMDILYIVILLVMFFSVNSREELDWINKVILFSGAACAAYTLIWFLVNIGIWPRSLFYEFDYTTAFGQHEGYTHMTNTNSSMLIPILPMCFVTVMTTPKTEKKRFKWFQWGELFLCLVAAVLSGRRVIWASIPFALVFVIILAILHPQRVRYFGVGANRKKLFIILAVVSAVGVFLITRGYINLHSVMDRFGAVLVGGSEEGERAGQARDLIEGFLRYPLLGSGSGASAGGELRNVDFTWAYELSYHAMLFHSGIIGFTLYVAALVSIAAGLMMGAKKKNRSYQMYVALLAGLMMGYIANASNPYFSSSFDFLWWILWPVGFIYAEDRISRTELEPGFYMLF